MTQVNTDNIPISACCNASTRVIGHTTKHYFCEACEQPCDLKVEVNTVESCNCSCHSSPGGRPWCEHCTTVTHLNTVTNDDVLENVLHQVFEIGYQQGLAGNTGATKMSLNSSHFMQLITVDRDKAVLDGQIKELENMKSNDVGYVVTVIIDERITELQNQRKAMDNE